MLSCKLTLYRKKTMDIKEKDQKEMLQHAILKRDLIALFDDYKSSRTGYMTALFRDHALTVEKIIIVDRVMKFINNFSGSKDTLITQLKKERIAHSELSLSYHKFHFNLLERRLTPYYWYDEGGGRVREVKKNVRRGESANISALANVFHEAIEIVERSWPNKIKDGSHLACEIKCEITK